MKKFFICIACLMALVLLIPAVYDHFYNKEHYEGKGYVPMAIQVDGRMYYAMVTDDYEPTLSLDDSAIDGCITSSVESGQWPTADDQANFSSAEGRPYAVVNDVLLLKNKYDDSWLIFRPTTRGNDDEEDQSMKKSLICIACLLAVAIIVPSVIWLFRDKTPEGGDYVPNAVMVDGQLYYADLPVEWETAISVEEDRIDGTITSKVDGSQWPEKDGQCNFMIGDDAAYAVVENALLVRNYNRWTIFQQVTWEVDG